MGGVRKDSKQLNGAYNAEHHLLEIKEVPDSLITFRRELNKDEHADIFLACTLLNTFEECMAKICEKLDIVVDGQYDMGPMCEMLTTALQNRHKLKAGVISSYELAPGLVSAEIEETSEEIKLQRVETTELEETPHVIHEND